MKIAVKSSDVEIDIAVISRTSHHTRELCGAGNIADDAGLTEIDPSTGIGQLRRSQMNRLILARFRQPACKLTERCSLRETWQGTLQTGFSLRMRNNMATSLLLEALNQTIFGSSSQRSDWHRICWWRSMLSRRWKWLENSTTRLWRMTLLLSPLQSFESESRS